MNDSDGLQRFVDAQTAVYADVLAELAAGQKRSHWMWFVFPQLQGLGFSATSQRFGIASREEAQAYRCHPLLGPRLSECTTLVLEIPNKSAVAIFGSPDDLKFRSSMTLFGEIAPAGSVFQRAIERYFGGSGDLRTLALLRG